MADVQMTHVPYRGASPAFADLIPGRVDCYFGSGALLSYSRSGQVRVLHGSETRCASPGLRDVRFATTNLPRRRSARSGLVASFRRNVSIGSRRANQCAGLPPI